jgi:hypothetical protein
LFVGGSFCFVCFVVVLVSDVDFDVVEITKIVAVNAIMTTTRKMRRAIILVFVNQKTFFVESVQANKYKLSISVCCTFYLKIT